MLTAPLEVLPTMGERARHRPIAHRFFAGVISEGLSGSG